MSHHDKKGRFTSPDRAHTVSKEGERYKVVRQLRRMKPKKRPARERATEAIMRERRQLQRFALIGALSGPGWVNLHEAFGDLEEAKEKPLSDREKKELPKANSFLMDWEADGGTIPPKLDRYMNAGHKLLPSEAREIIEFFRTHAPGNY